MKNINTVRSDRRKKKETPHDSIASDSRPRASRRTVSWLVMFAIVLESKFKWFSPTPLLQRVNRQPITLNYHQRCHIDRLVATALFRISESRSLVLPCETNFSGGSVSMNGLLTSCVVRAEYHPLLCGDDQTCLPLNNRSTGNGGSPWHGSTTHFQKKKRIILRRVGDDINLTLYFSWHTIADAGRDHATCLWK